MIVRAMLLQFSPLREVMARLGRDVIGQLAGI